MQENKQPLIIGIVLVVILATTLIFVGYSKNETTTEQSSEVATSSEVSESVTLSDGAYAVAPESLVTWFGKKTIIKDWTHNGVIKVKSGEAVVKDGLIVSGKILLDMNTIESTDKNQGKNDGGDKKLDGHLKSKDFFDVQKYPEASFEIKSSEVIEGITNINGVMTIKGVSKEMVIPVSIKAAGEKIVLAFKDFSVNRVDFGVSAMSGSVVKNLGDNVVDDMMVLGGEIVLLSK